MFSHREPKYDGQLLDLAYDLGVRLLPAFDTRTGIPVHRINLMYVHRQSLDVEVGWDRQLFLRPLGVGETHLRVLASDPAPSLCGGRYGVPPQETRETCTAAAGTLILEMGLLSRLTGDYRYGTSAL